jgi:hypothetical protein
MERRDRTFFCVVGTLLAMAVVVYQGDYSGYQREALAAKKAAAAPSGNIIGYRCSLVNVPLPPSVCFSPSVPISLSLLPLSTPVPISHTRARALHFIVR